MAPASSTPVPNTPAPPDMPTPSTPSLPASTTSTFDKLKRNTAIGCLVVCPIIMLLPPRKLDFFTFGLAGATLLSTNYLVQQERGTGIAGRVGQLVAGNELPTERAREFQELRRRAKEEREGLVRDSQRSASEVVEEPRREGGVLRRLWMGGEEEGWKERRLREEREAIEEGKGYGGLIAEQIWEVVNQGKKEAEEVEERELKEAVERQTGKETTGVDERRREG
ncbi:hypothetical protein K490DRAFT_56975 [Saccharata proteae CBS 121410]|uniref:Rhomboid family membrane protein n=1 Tax=Saccharata proteae CBS 121410 TaxID=1314787 RepID=A0A9P4HY50_9PEZI|nr:hypothetical protein K490DRAFT_56975 [Saccharata proteae CBS 121410]